MVYRFGFGAASPAGAFPTAGPPVTLMAAARFAREIAGLADDGGLQLTVEASLDVGV